MDESVQKHIEEALPKVGKYQHIADAMLRGCKLTKPAIGVSCDGDGRACALGAWAIAVGLMTTSEFAVCRAIYLFPADAFRDYKDRYGCTPPDDNDAGRFTREQIAARIAAL